jgi:hypothetical protein
LSTAPHNLKIALDVQPADPATLERDDVVNVKLHPMGAGQRSRYFVKYAHLRFIRPPGDALSFGGLTLAGTLGGACFVAGFPSAD